MDWSRQDTLRWWNITLTLLRLKTYKEKMASTINFAHLTKSRPGRFNNLETKIKRFKRVTFKVIFKRKIWSLTQYLGFPLKETWDNLTNVIYPYWVSLKVKYFQSTFLRDGMRTRETFTVSLHQPGLFHWECLRNFLKTTKGNITSVGDLSRRRFVNNWTYLCHNSNKMNFFANSEVN